LVARSSGLAHLVTLKCGLEEIVTSQGVWDTTRKSHF